MSLARAEGIGFPTSVRDNRRRAEEYFKPIRQEKEAEEKARLDAEAKKRELSDFKEVTKKLIFTSMLPDFVGAERLYEGDDEVLQARQQMAASENAKVFVAEEPRYHCSKNNFDTMADAMIAQKLAPSVANYKAVFELLYAAELLETPKPAVVSPVESDETVTTKVGDFTGSEIPTKRPSGIQTNGYDLVTGAPKIWSDYELENLTSDQYRKALRIPRKYSFMPMGTS